MNSGKEIYVVNVGRMLGTRNAERIWIENINGRSSRKC